ncbi:hypothetical protein THRCLA_00064, partial [Thraustotheca clavata]
DAVVDCQRVFGHERVVIFSNSAGSKDDAPHFEEAKSIEELMKIKVLCHGTKKPEGITELVELMQVEPHELVMVGDRYSTDILFGNSYGMLTIRTEQLSKDNESVLNLTMQAIEEFIIARLVANGVQAPVHDLYKV